MLQGAGGAGGTARHHEPVGVELQQHRLALDVAHREGDVAGQPLRGVPQIPDIGHALEDAAREMVAERLEARPGLGHPRQGELQGRAEADDARHVLRARAQPALLPAAVDQRREPRTAFHVQRAAALGAVELVRGQAQHVDAERADVDGHGAHGLHGVGVEQRALVMSDARQLGDGLDGADHVVGVHDRRQPRVVAKGLLVGVHVDDAVAVDGDEVDGPPETVEGARRFHDRRMLDGADDEVTGLETLEIADERQVVGLRAAGGEDDLLLAGAEAGSHLGARLLHSRAGISPQTVKLRRVAVAFAEERQHLLEDPGVDRRGRRVVEVHARHLGTASRVRSSSVIELRAPLMALSRRRHTTREAQDSARSQPPSSGTQPTRESGPSSAVTTSPTAMSPGGCASWYPPLTPRVALTRPLSRRRARMRSRKGPGMPSAAAISGRGTGLRSSRAARNTMALSPYSQREEMRIHVPSSPVSNPNRKGWYYGTTTDGTVKPQGNRNGWCGSAAPGQ